MVAVWQSVPTAAVSFSNAGALLPAGSYTGGDLSTIQQFNDVMGSCNAASQNPIIFDADGSLLTALGLPSGVVGISSPCAVDSTTGFITAASILMNGKFQDGINTPRSSPPNFEASAGLFDQAITHEIGHLLGLDHSQINVDLLNTVGTPCDPDKSAGLPLMFPEIMCTARKDSNLPVLAPDDVAWISTLYPSASFLNSYGTISGVIRFSDGTSPFQGANVIARLVDDPNTPEDESRRVAVSVVSGYRFTGNIGQSITATMPDPRENNTAGSSRGSRDGQLIGFYEIAVPPGTYTVEVEAVDFSFTGGSGLGPLDSNPGVNAEFWNRFESAFDFPLQRDTITVHSGDHVTGVDIILSLTQPRFDQYEDGGALMRMPKLFESNEKSEVLG
jgi:hypothetical protein